jgi:hypothetical protein
MLKRQFATFWLLKNTKTQKAQEMGLIESRISEAGKNMQKGQAETMLFGIFRHHTKLEKTRLIFSSGATEAPDDRLSNSSDTREAQLDGSSMEHARSRRYSLFFEKALISRPNEGSAVRITLGYSLPG